VGFANQEPHLTFFYLYVAIQFFTLKKTKNSKKNNKKYVIDVVMSFSTSVSKNLK